MGWIMRNKLILICSTLAAAYWLLESVVDVLFAGETSFMNQVFSPDPNELWMRLTTLALFISLGAYAQALVNRHRRMEETVRSSEASLSVTLHSIGDAVIATDLEGRVTLMNPVAQELTGWRLEEAKGRPVSEVFRIINEATRKPVESPIEKVLREEVVVWLANHTSLLSRDGREIPIDDTVAPIKDGEGKVSGVVLVFHDITERRRAEEGLRESEARYRSLVDAAANTKQGIVVLQDQEGVEAACIFSNAEAERLIGSPKGVLEKSSWFDLLAAKDRNTARERYAMRLRGESYPKVEITLLSQDGEEIPVEVNSASSQFEGKEALVVFFRDIRERKKAEERRRALELQLAQSKKMESLGTLAGGIAHDFNNILAAIIGYSELALADAEKGVSNSSQIKEVIKAGERAKELVTQILTFSRKLEPAFKLIDLNQVIDQTERILERTIPKMIEIEHHLAEDLWLISADPSQISQVLLNLGANAGDAMPQGGRLVIETENVTLDQDYVEQHLEASPGDYVKLTVSDTGHGLNKETLEQIFDPFFTNKEVGQGTGLGLATVYGIVQSHHGYIICYSEVGRGTTFKVYLPAVRLTEPPETIAEEAVEGDLEGGDETILLVDDEGVLRELGRQILTRQGYRVLLAKTGEEALDLYREEGGGIDLIVLDISMPGMGGHRCLQGLLRTNPQARVVITSGYSRNGQLKDTLSSGAAGFIPKPFSRRELLKTVREVLDG